MGQGILGPGDTAIPIDVDSVFVAEIPPALNGRYPAAESPAMALDGVTTTKYLNFGGNGSGFIVTPLLPIPVESFRITTANDALGRDPASWALYGRNGALTTVDSGPLPAINADWFGRGVDTHCSRQCGTSGRTTDAGAGRRRQ